MNSYHGNEKPYVYVCCSKADDLDEILNELGADGTALCLSENYDKKEEKRIAAAYGVLFLISKNLVKEEKFQKTLEYAIAINKNIVSVYLEDVEMAPSLMLQVDLRKFFFADRFKDNAELANHLKKESIFTNMEVTKQQVKGKRNRIIMIAAAAVVALFVLFPYSKSNPIEIPIIENIGTDKEALAPFGLSELSKEELQNLKTLYMIGDTVIEDPDTIDSIEIEKNTDGTYSYTVLRKDASGSVYKKEKGDIHQGEISDLSALKKVENLENLCLAFQNIEDVSVFSEFKNLSHLDLRYNPVSSLAGIENCENLVSICLDGTPIKDVSPLFTAGKLTALSLENCENVDSIDGIENCKVSELNIYGTSIRNIDSYASIDGECSFKLSPLDSYEFLLENDSYASLSIYDARPDDYIPYLQNAVIKRMHILDDHMQWISDLYGLKISESLSLDSNTCYALYRMYEYLPGLPEIDLGDCYSMIDFSPLVYSDVERLIIDKTQKRFVDRELTDNGIEIYYKDNGELIRYYPE